MWYDIVVKYIFLIDMSWYYQRDMKEIWIKGYRSLDPFVWLFARPLDSAVVLGCDTSLTNLSYTNLALGPLGLTFALVDEAILAGVEWVPRETPWSSPCERWQQWPLLVLGEMTPNYFSIFTFSIFLFIFFSNYLINNILWPIFFRKVF